MKKKIWLGCLGLCLWACGAGAQETEEYEWVPITEAFQGHLDVGTRLTYYWLLDKESDSFIGTIDTLSAEQNLMPYKLFADIWFNDYVGTEITWDQFKAGTTTSEDGHSDGDFTLNGLMLLLQGRWIITDSAFTPYGGMGAAFYQGDFDPESWWALGYGSKTAWEAAGRPSDPYKGITREISVNSPVGFVAQAGVDIGLMEHCSLDLLLRYNHVNLTADYTRINKKAGGVEEVKDKDIPMSNITLALGIKYVF